MASKPPRQRSQTYCRRRPLRPAVPQEIGGYSWYRVSEMPSTREESTQQYQSADGGKIKFYMVSVAASALGTSLNTDFESGVVSVASRRMAARFGSTW